MDLVEKEKHRRARMASSVHTTTTAASLFSLLVFGYLTVYIHLANARLHTHFSRRTHLGRERIWIHTHKTISVPHQSYSHLVRQYFTV